ncbi:MAG: GWxTD domain-containing protein, partial [Candidatus Krumholzibacteria bacterium]|nr:GWxTD domain-containing protein [Candidatus Krumholzibacteria bacterium]
MSGKLVLVCAAATFCFAAADPARGQGMLDRPVEETAFELSVSQEFDESSKPTIVVSASIPYRRLVFFLRGERYEARYRVYLELKERRGTRAPGRVWEESVAVDNFRETTSAARFAPTRRTFPVDPGEYTAIVTIEVIDTSRRFREEQVVRVVGEESGRLGVSTPVFYTCREDSLSPKPRSGEIAVSLCPFSGGAGARINPGAVYGDFGGWVRVVLGVVAPAAQTGDSLVLTARMRDASGAVVLYTKETLPGGGARHSGLCLEIGLDSLPIGEYGIDAVLETADGAQRSQSTGEFALLFNTGLLFARIGDLIDLLSLVADEKEARAVAEAPAAERVRAWALFWRKLDPTTATESNEAFGDFLQRLRYVLKSFSKHQPGWRTDMGQIYIQNGRPDKVEDR